MKKKDKKYIRNQNFYPPIEWGLRGGAMYVTSAERRQLSYGDAHKLYRLSATESFLVADICFANCFQSERIDFAKHISLTTILAAGENAEIGYLVEV